MNSRITDQRDFSPQLLLVEFVARHYLRRPSIDSIETVRLYNTDAKKLDTFFATKWCDERGIAPRPMQLGDFSEPLLQAAMRYDVDVRKTAVRTANRLRRHALAVWQYASDMSVVENQRNPEVPLIHPPKRALCPPFPSPKLEPECWSLAELGLLLDAAATMRGQINKDVRASTFHVAHMWFCYNTGARIDAVMRAPLANLDLDRGEVKLPAFAQKQNADQTFDLLPETIDALKRLCLHERYPPTATIFSDWPYDPAPGDWQVLTGRLRKMLKAAGLRCGRTDLFHKLRRTFATHLAIEKGIVAAQQWLGHSSVQVTWGYIDMRFYRGPRLNGSLPSPRPIADQVQLRIFKGDEAAS